MELTEKKALKNAKDLIRDVSLFEDEIECALNSSYGISDWFKSYIASPEYEKLSQEYKKKAFESYEALKWLLDNIVHHYQPSETNFILNVDPITVSNK